VSVESYDVFPDGWTVTTVESLAANEPAAITDGPFGSNLKSEHYTDVGPRVIRLQNIGDGIFLDAEAHIPESHFATLRKHEACTGDVVVAMLGEDLPRACLVPESLGPAIVKADCVRLRVHPAVALPEYVMAGLNSQTLRRQAAELMHGVGRPRLGLQWFRGLSFPVAPLSEQRRIVEALDSYFTRLDDAVATLERVERNLKRYRASVLKSAVEGRLVPTEAALAKQEGRDYEPASVLLERILTERRRRWIESGRKGKYQEPEFPDTKKLPQLPAGWCWATIDALIVGGPQNGIYVPKSQYGRGTPILRIDDYQIEWSRGSEELQRIEISDADAKTYRLRVNDIVINRVNSPSHLGKSMSVSARNVPAVFESNIMRMSLAAGVDARYVQSYLSSGDGKTRLIENAKWAVNQASINQGDVAHTAIPLPPVTEQVRIVAEVNRLLSMAQMTSAAAERNATRCHRLRQSILKWAFEGKLADQDPSDEPASVLLARIKAERDQTQPAKKKSRA